MIYAPQQKQEKPERPGIEFVILGFGYVESAIVGNHIYQLQLNSESSIKEPPRTAAATLKLLAADFLELYKDEFPNRFKVDGNFDIETFQWWLYDLGKADCDSMPCDGSGGFGHWWPYPAWADILAAPKEVFLEVFEQTEMLMCAALDPQSFETENRKAVIQWQQDFLKNENRFKAQPTYLDIDSVLEKRTKRPGYGERVH